MRWLIVIDLVTRGDSHTPRQQEANMTQTSAVIPSPPSALMTQSRRPEFRAHARVHCALMTQSRAFLKRRPPAWRNCLPFPPSLPLMTQRQGKLQPQFNRMRFEERIRDWRGRGRHLFDVSSTVLGAILNCVWTGVGGGDTCLMLAALSWVRYWTASGLFREGETLVWC